MNMISCVMRALILVMALFSVSGASAQSGLSAEAIEKNRIANQQCFACHAEAALKHPPKAGLDLQKLRMFVVDPDVFKGSDHGNLACTKCHNEGYTDFPHAADAKDSTSICEDCHSKKVSQIQPEFEKSVHAKHMGDTFTCMNCHNPHLMRLAAKLGDAGKIVAQDNRVCLGCHDSDETFAKFAPEKKSRPLIDEIHSWLPNTRLHWQSVRCVECHTPVSTTGMLSHEILDKTKAERKCVTCHTVNSALNVRLYRSLVDEEQHKYGFVNSIMLSQSYVIGATRNPTLDAIVAVLIALTLVGVLLHGLLRYIAAKRRGRKPE
jgi:predicted CXXCH cytochrome family protein